MKQDSHDDTVVCTGPSGDVDDLIFSDDAWCRSER